MQLHRWLRIVLLLHCCMSGIWSAAQQGRTIRFTSANAMFPDTARAGGHDYNGKHYDAASHYSDSSVLVYVPAKFKPTGRYNLVFWFHGWGNNIDSACKQYLLLEQFEASGRNAIFIFPEGPKNAPDSYGGKLEQAFVFQQLTKEVMGKLAENGIVKYQQRFDISDLDITLAGHSGAYRVIGQIINKTPVKEVILFDALYGGNDAYLQWLSDPQHRFINIYTKDGGTYDNSLLVVKKATDSLRVPVLDIEEILLTDHVLRSNNKVNIYSAESHNGVITHGRNWELFLRNTPAVP